MDSWAAGLNYYLATHPQVRPRVLTRFEPWMALSFTEGSIGGDIERIELGELQKILSRQSGRALCDRQRPRGLQRHCDRTVDHGGGTGAAADQPHTSFFFRSELQVTSDEGSNAYGAATWGSSSSTRGSTTQPAGCTRRAASIMSMNSLRRSRNAVAAFAIVTARIAARDQRAGDDPLFRSKDGKFATREFTTWHTHRGPIVREANGRWIAFAMMDKPVAALQQSFLRTKTRDLKDFLRVADLKANSSNDTIFASAKGEVAYLHPQFVPVRNDRFDYTKPVDGSDPATDWGRLHTVAELPNTINPPNGWVQNTNTWPYRAAGPSSPDPKASRSTWTCMGKITAASMRSSCLRQARVGRSSGFRPRRSIATNRALPNSSRSS
jgi:acyl-homoserine-lactone acylase